MIEIRQGAKKLCPVQIGVLEKKIQSTVLILKRHVRRAAKNESNQQTRMIFNVRNKLFLM